MKSMLVISLGLCALALVWADGMQCDASITAQCPDENGPVPIFLPVPWDCRQYCECSDGIAWLFECAPGTLFDAEKGYCDWENNVDCEERPIPIPSTSTYDDESYELQEEE